MFEVDFVTRGVGVVTVDQFHIVRENAFRDAAAITISTNAPMPTPFDTEMPVEFVGTLTRSRSVLREVDRSGHCPNFL